MSVNISMQTVSLAVKFKSGNAITVNQFSDDGTPISIDSTQIADGNKTLNGTLVMWVKPTPYTLSFTLIPGSDDDNKLRSELQLRSLGVNPAAPLAIEVDSIVITYPTNLGAKKVTYHDGYLRSGMEAIGSDSEGKASASTYEFAFESITSESK